MASRKHIIVDGLVQGVGYRYFNEKLARGLGIKGWTRNNPDGTVELDVEGDEKNINEFIERLRSGHPWAKVKNITVEDSPSGGSYKNFEIR